MYCYTTYTVYLAYLRYKKSIEYPYKWTIYEYLRKCLLFYDTISLNEIFYPYLVFTQFNIIYSIVVFLTRNIFP